MILGYAFFYIAYLIQIYLKAYNNYSLIQLACGNEHDVSHFCNFNYVINILISC